MLARFQSFMQRFIEERPDKPELQWKYESNKLTNKNSIDLIISDIQQWTLPNTKGRISDMSDPDMVLEVASGQSEVQLVAKDDARENEQIWIRNADYDNGYFSIIHESTGFFLTFKDNMARIQSKEFYFSV